MQKSAVTILWLLLLMGCTSYLYFVALLVQLPFVVTTLLVIASGILLCRWMCRRIPTDAVPAYNNKKRIVVYAVFAIGMGVIAYRACGFADKYGGWDAWCLWNMHAKYLDHSNWRQLYTNYALRFKHPDYPLYLSGNIAFVWRLLGGQYALVPFGIGLLVVLLIPALTYLDLYKRNFMVAVAIMVLFAIDHYYLWQGVQQYSDTLLALLFLATIICTQHYRESGANNFLTLAAALAGCCMWTKNEGLMLAFLWMAFNAKTLIWQGRWKYFLAGISVPLVVLLMFKHITPANDLVAKTTSLSKLILDPTRYIVIGQWLKKNLETNFFYFIPCLVLYVIGYIRTRTIDNSFLLIMACIAGYLAVYVVTPLNLPWQLRTSMDRVLHQVMPAFIYVVGVKLAIIKRRYKA